MKLRSWMSMTAVYLVVALATTLPTSAQTTTTFNVPGAGTAAGLGTVPAGINLLGVIAGLYVDSSGCGGAVKNQLHALAMGEGVCRKKKLFPAKGRKELEGLTLGPWASYRRQELLRMFDELAAATAHWIWR